LISDEVIKELVNVSTVGIRNKKAKNMAARVLRTVCRRSLFFLSLIASYSK
jgi:hypothetical protein